MMPRNWRMEEHGVLCMKRKMIVAAVVLAAVLAPGMAVAKERSPLVEFICEHAPAFCFFTGLSVG